MTTTRIPTAAAEEEDVYRDLLEQLINTAAFVNGFPTTDFAARLHYKATRTQRTNEFQSHGFLDMGRPWPSTDPHPASKILAALDCNSDLTWLAEITFADAIKEVDSRFSSRVDSGACEKIYGETIMKMTYFLEHLNMVFEQRPIQVAGKDLKDCLAIREKHPEFGKYMKDQISKLPFIQATIQQDVGQGNSFRSMCILFLADYLCRSSDRFEFGTPKDFGFSPSFDILKEWSYNLWAIKKKDLDHMRKPTSTYDVTVSLYKLIEGHGSGDDQYIKEVHEALGELIRRDLNVWNSIYTGLSTIWKANQYPLWKNAVSKEIQTGQAYHVDEWIKDGYVWESGQEDPGNPHPKSVRRVIRPPTAPAGSYLVEGTWITLASGMECRAESLRVSDTIMTLAKPAQSSNISKDIELMEVTAHLIGFNNGKPFAITAQVFHSTTGLRAVDPDAAKAQNPWLQVGRLAEGHIIYRLRPGQHAGYDLVEIESIHETAQVKKNMYALHLQDSVRSHHMNGFLVNTNEPEINSTDIATLLSQFSTSDQIQLLSSTAEVRSLIRKFGPQTVKDRLQLELAGYRTSAVGSPAFFTNSNVQRTQSHRPLAESNLEYQLVTVVQKQQLPVRDPPIVSLVDGVLSLDNKVQLRAAVNDGDRAITWTRPIEHSALYEHGWLKINDNEHGGNGVLLYSPSLETKSLQDGQLVRIRAFRSDDVFEGSPSQGSFESTLSPSRSKFVTSMDKKAWKKNETLAKPQDPIDFDSIFTGVTKQTGKFEVDYVEIPFLDKLRDAINNLRNGKEKLGKLYSSHTETYLGQNKRGIAMKIFRMVVNFDQAAIAKSLSDQPQTPFNITFKKLLGQNSDIYLPVLFQSLYFEKEDLGSTITGALYLYDPSKRECKGERHMIAGKWTHIAIAAERRQRALVSRAFAKLGSAGQDPRLRPAAVTLLLPTEADVTIEDILGMSYNEAEVHSLVQTTINNMMYYHMDSQQRKDFTTFTQPTLNELPDELRTQLPDDLKSFLKDKYAPAFIARNISQIEQFAKDFKGNESDKVWYWWAGQGPKCLSRSKEYQQLNNLASIFAMKKLHKELDNLEKHRAEDLAEDLFKAAIDGPTRDQILQSGVDTGRTINKVCCILNVLAPKKNYAGQLFKSLTQTMLKKAAQQPRLSDEDQKDTKEYLGDALHDLIEKILLNDKSVTGPVRDQLEKDFEDFMKANNISLGGSIDQKVASILTLMSVFTVEVARLLSVVSSSALTAFGGTRLFQLAGAVVDKAAVKLDKIGFGKKLAKGLGGLVIVSFLVGQVLPLVGVIKDWKNLNASQRATAILEALRAVIGAAGKAIESFQTWKKEGLKAEDTAVESSILSEVLGDELASNASADLVGLADRDDFYKKEGGLEMIAAEHFNKGGSVNSDETIPGEVEVWDESVNEKPPNAIPGEEETASKLSVTSKWLRGFNICLGFAVSASMTFSLVHDWDKLTNAGKIINTLSVAVQILSVVIDTVDMALTAGLIASATLSAAIPVIGAVLAIAGIVLMIVSLFYDMYKKEEPPNPVRDFVENIARRLIGQWDSPPGTYFKYNVHPSPVQASGKSDIVITANSPGSEDSVKYTQISVWSGHQESCLFSEEDFWLKEDTKHTNGGRVAVSDTKTVKTYLDQVLLQENKNNQLTKYSAFNLSCSGPRDKENPGGHLKLAAGMSFTATWSGLISAAGKSVIEIVETLTTGDIARTTLPILRK